MRGFEWADVVIAGGMFIVLVVLVLVLQRGGGMSELKIGSLFSGYGGLDMAVESVTGARTAWVSDIDKGACKILAHRYPGVPNLGDLTAIDWTTVEPVDIITGGFPCQDLSHAGKGAGLKSGTRSGLWSYMCEAVNIIRPRLVVAENVRGLLSAEALRPVEPCTWCVGDDTNLDMRALGAVLADLADIGYDASWYGLRAADIGACHGRWRCFIVAHPHGEQLQGIGSLSGLWRRPDTRSDVRLLPTPDTGESPNGHGRRGGKSGNGHQSGASLDQLVALLPTPTTQDGANTGGVSQAARLLPTPNAGNFADGADLEDWEASRAELAKNGYNGNGRGTPIAVAVRQADFGQYADAIARWEAVIGRPAPSPTEPTGKDGARRLSPKFTEWMMGLPDGWITDVPGISRNEALKACGNGVVPQQAATALRMLLTATERAA